MLLELTSLSAINVDVTQCCFTFNMATRLTFQQAVRATLQDTDSDEETNDDLAWQFWEHSASTEKRFLCDLQNKITLVSYSTTHNRSVLLINIARRRVIDDQSDLRRPEMIMDYNQGKGAVDHTDENSEEFSFVRKTVRLVFSYFSICLMSLATVLMCSSKGLVTRSQKRIPPWNVGATCQLFRKGASPSKSKSSVTCCKRS